MRFSVCDQDSPDSSTSMPARASETAMTVLLAISFTHLLNDTLQALIPSLYPLFKEELKLSYAQLGLVTLTFQGVASLLQPVVGLVTDKRPMPYSLVVGMGCSFAGLVLLGYANHFFTIIAAAALMGLGSSIFHPEASRVAHQASGGKRGMAQSLFQVGGNAGSAIGPLAVALIVMPAGQRSVVWFSLVAATGMLVLWRVGAWMSRRLHQEGGRAKKQLSGGEGLRLPLGRVCFALSLLLVLIFSKYVYLASMTSFYTFFLMERFGVEAHHSQILLFVFLFAVAAGTILGGPIGDRIGRKPVIWVSILGVAPFALCLPYVNLAGTVVLSVLIGVILASAFSAILVYAQDLVPGRVGLIAGLFFGLAFGIAGISSAVLGRMADAMGIEEVYRLCAFLPLLGLVAVFLPSGKKAGRPGKKAGTV